MIWVGYGEHVVVEGVLDAETATLEDLADFIEYKASPNYHYLMAD